MPNVGAAGPYRFIRGLPNELVPTTIVGLSKESITIFEIGKHFSGPERSALARPWAMMRPESIFPEAFDGRPSGSDSFVSKRANLVGEDGSPLLAPKKGPDPFFPLTRFSPMVVG